MVKFNEFNTEPFPDEIKYRVPQDLFDKIINAYIGGRVVEIPIKFKDRIFVKKIGNRDVLVFYDVRFKGVEFNSTTFENMMFKNCYFKHCEFWNVFSIRHFYLLNCGFKFCEFKGLELYSSIIYKNSFENCRIKNFKMSRVLSHTNVFLYSVMDSGSDTTYYQKMNHCRIKLMRSEYSLICMDLIKSSLKSSYFGGCGISFKDVENGKICDCTFELSSISVEIESDLLDHHSELEKSNKFVDCLKYWEFMQFD